MTVRILSKIIVLKVKNEFVEDSSFEIKLNGCGGSWSSSIIENGCGGSWSSSIAENGCSGSWSSSIAENGCGGSERVNTVGVNTYEMIVILDAGTPNVSDNAFRMDILSSSDIVNTPLSMMGFTTPTIDKEKLICNTRFGS